VPVVTKRIRVADGYYWISVDPGQEFVVPDPGGANGLVGVSPGVGRCLGGGVRSQPGHRPVGRGCRGVAGQRPGRGGPERYKRWGLIGGVPAAGPARGGQLPGPGTRSRTRRRGRQDVVSGRPVEEHLIQIWPASAAPEIIQKTTDEMGAARRESGPGPGPRLPHGLPVLLDIHRPVTMTDRVTIELLRIDVGRGGCEFTIKAVVDVSGMTAREEKRAWRAVDGYRRAALPGTDSADPLRVCLRFADDRTAEYSDNPGDLPRSGPGVTDCFRRMITAPWRRTSRRAGRPAVLVAPRPGRAGISTCRSLPGRAP
jgi:hypothetical protein